MSLLPSLYTFVLRVALVAMKNYILVCFNDIKWLKKPSRSFVSASLAYSNCNLLILFNISSDFVLFVSIVSHVRFIYIGAALPIC